MIICVIQSCIPSLSCIFSSPPYPLPVSLSFYCWIWHRMVWSIPLISLGQLSWLCHLSASCWSPAYWPLRRGWRDNLDAAWALLNSTKTSVSYQHGSSYKYKTQQERAAMVKIKSFPAISNTESLEILWLIIVYSENEAELNTPGY